MPGPVEGAQDGMTGEKQAPCSEVDSTLLSKEPQIGGF